jgi:hypothetical protein
VLLNRGSFWAPVYHILDANHEPVMMIKGPCCICDGAFCPCENKFNVQRSNYKFILFK